MHPLTCLGTLGGAALMTVDRTICKVPDRLAVLVYLACLGLMLAGALLKKRMG